MVTGHHRQLAGLVCQVETANKAETSLSGESPDDFMYITYLFATLCKVFITALLLVSIFNTVTKYSILLYLLLLF